MATIRQVYKNIHAVKFDRVVEETIKSCEDEIIRLNVDQMQDGKGKDDADLKHTDSKKYRGVYKPLTQEIAETDPTVLPKRAGELYNFGWTGAFLSNFEVKVDNKEYEIFSTGTGGGDKAEFFRGFRNLFGLNKKSRTLLVENTLQSKLVNNYKKAAKLI